MAQQVSRLNLGNYNFPLLSNGRGKTIELGSPLDIPASNVAGQRDDVNKPALIYCENLMPTTEGYRSAKYLDIIAAANNPVATFGETYNVAASDGALGWFSPAGGTNQLWKGTTWNGLATFGAGIEHSHANINGQSYVCWEFTALKRINITAGTLSENTDAGDTLVGISIANIKGICASGNYLIAYGDQTISWSNPANPMDFTPSLITGAGTATPADLKGKIVAVLQVANGFMIYTTQNIVSAVASGNTAYPFIFKHIAGSTGVKLTGDAISEDIGESNLAWTLDGFHEVSVSGVTSVLPDVTDFIKAKLLESYNATTGVLTVTELTNELFVALHRLSDRYLVISYGTAEYDFQYVLIYDSALKRWGKLAIAHAEVILLPATQAATHNEICFIAKNGATKQMSLSATNTGADGVAIFGRVTTTRTSMTTLQKVSVEGPKLADVMAVKVGVNYIGGVVQQLPVTLTAIPNGTNRDYNTFLTGSAHYLHLTGMLNLTCVTVTTTQGGVR